MFGQHRWMLGVATSTSILGLTMTSGLVFLANRLVDEFSHPHEIVSMEEFQLPLPSIVPEPPRSYQRPLTFETSDGTLLCGDFWAQPQPAPTVVMCHGYRASRAHLRNGAALEYSLGYNVLLFDLRGHGDSDSIITSGGNAEVRDLEAAIIVARLQPETLPHSIIIHGFSMGAAIALLTPPQPGVAAIIADSPFARSDEILMRLINYRLTAQTLSFAHLRHLHSLSPALAWTLVTTSKLVFRARFGYTFVARPESIFKRWVKKAKREPERKHIPILLIHAVGDELIPISHANTLVARAKANGVPIETYFVDHSTHCGAFIHNPAQYTAVIQAFLACHMQANTPPLKAYPKTQKSPLSGQRKRASLKAGGLLKAEERIGQAEKGQVGTGELIPANDETTVAIEPGVEAFHHPPSWSLARLMLGGVGSLLRSGSLP